MFGRQVELGVSLWRDLTSDGRVPECVGLSFAVPGPKSLELTAGAYVGNSISRSPGAVLSWPE